MPGLLDLEALQQLQAAGLIGQLGQFGQFGQQQGGGLLSSPQFKNPATQAYQDAGAAMLPDYLKTLPSYGQAYRRTDYELAPTESIERNMYRGPHGYLYGPEQIVGPSLKDALKLEEQYMQDSLDEYGDFFHDPLGRDHSKRKELYQKAT